MSKPRRAFFKDLLALAALQGFAASPASARSIAALLEQASPQGLNPDFDARSFNFWSNFLASDAQPILSTSQMPGKGAASAAEQMNKPPSQSTGSSAPPSVPLNQSASQTGGSSAAVGGFGQSAGQTRGSGASLASDLQPVFLHYDPDGFKNAAELDPSKLIPEGDVSVSLNSSAIRIAPQDQSTFDRLQNAQVRLDFAQRAAVLPTMEAMVYTIISGMASGGQGAAAKSSPVQSLSSASDQSWQKMRNIILPGGEGRWALNLEAQKKDSLFCKVLQIVVNQDGHFASMIGLPGIAMSALQSFNVLYGALHAEPVRVIESNPVRAFATQEAIQKSSAPGYINGIMLAKGQYVLVSAKQAPTSDQLKNLTVSRGRVVPQNTPSDIASLDAAAAETLKGVTYVSFDVQVQPTTLLSGGSQKKSNG